MKFLKALLLYIIIFVIMGLGYILFIGKPITLSKYYSKHDVSSMSVYFKNEDGTNLEKELSEAEMEGFMKRFGTYKVFNHFYEVALSH